MKIALAQMKMSRNIQANYEKSLRLIREASEQGAELICFPEIQLSPFFPQYPGRDVSEYVMTEDSSYVNGIREACHDCHIFASPNLYIEENGRRYDMSLLIGDQGEIVGRQKMVHIAQCDLFYEQSYYTPSEEGLETEDGMTFSGESLLSDSMGNIVAIAGSPEELLVADVDVSGAAIVRKTRPYTSLRRTGLYE